MGSQPGRTRSARRPRYGGDVRISDDEWVKDEKTGELRLSEKGITRQKEDILALADRLGVDIVEWYPENDTTAFKKRRIRLPNGRSVWRVIRPEFRRMLRDYEDGRIDGVIFYDIDRLARQPRDLEDLIDLVEYYKRPVESVTGQTDLRTSNGRTMARVLVAMANKSSEDTSRRVARAKLQMAQLGKGGRFKGNRRRFGYRPDGSLIPEEVKVVRDAADEFLAGASWNGLATFFESSGVRPVRARNWSDKTIRQILLSPAVAGIAVYNGVLRPDNQDGRPRVIYVNPEGAALKDPSGKYVKGDWKPILTVEKWKAVVAEWEGRRKGAVFSAHGTRDYLLTGLLRCGRIRSDGSVCNRSLSGTVRKYKSGRVVFTYRCPPPSQGGCSGIERSMPKLDKLIEDLLFRHIEENQPDEAELSAVPDDDDPDVKELEDVQDRLRRLRAGFAQGTTSPDTLFIVAPMLEARERELKAEIAKTTRIRAGRVARSVPVEEVRQQWEDADGNPAVRRAILSRYLKAVIVRESVRHGPGELDYAAITPVWRKIEESMPDDVLVEDAIQQAMTTTTP